MSWPLRKLPSSPSDYGQTNIQAGHWWPCPWYLFEDGRPMHFLSVHYISDWMGKRPPVTIRLPGGADWILDGKSSNGLGWKVTGEEGLWTSVPSIQVDGFIHEGKVITQPYHGYLVKGTLSEDLGRRQYAK